VLLITKTSEKANGFYPGGLQDAAPSQSFC